MRTNSIVNDKKTVEVKEIFVLIKTTGKSTCRDVAIAM